MAETPLSKPTNSFDLAAYMKERGAKVEAFLDQCMQVAYPEKIYEAMRYTLMAGGKRLRPILCLATCELFDGTLEMAMPTACALEMLHTMSLIHDDLPSVDNDDYRRGRLTNHKVFGENIALFAGDGLIVAAFNLIATQTHDVEASQVLKVIARLGRATGPAGMIGGQIVDLEFEGKPDVSLDTLNFIHAHKTGALLEAALVSGAILAGAGSEDLEKLSKYGKDIGLAFQIVDDILDITSTQEELGKSTGKDVTAQKVTYPSFWGIEESKRRAIELTQSAKSEVEIFGERATPLLEIADFVVARTH